MKVGFRDHRGMGAPFADALYAAGHDVGHPGDVLLIDHYAPGPTYDHHFASCERAFLYPHGCGPLLHAAYPLREKVRGHFVIGTGQADLIDGLPSDVVGWPYGPLLPWRETEGRKVLFAPVHADGYGWLDPVMAAENARVHDELAQLPVDLRVRTLGPPSLSGLVCLPHVAYVGGGTMDGADIEWADVVVSGPGTFATLAVSQGCPTVVYGEHLSPVDRHPTTRAEVDLPRYFELLPTFRFPTVEGGMAEQIDVACSEDTAKAWRERFVGDPFDPARFAERFEKAVEAW